MLMVRMKKSFFIYAALPLLILSACGNNARNGGRHHVPCVKAVVVDSSSMSVVSREFIGTADGSYSAVLSFPLSGTVEKIYVREGERVEAGELVAELDSRVAESSLMAARAAFDRAQDGYERAGAVYEKGSMPEVKWIEVVSQRDQAAALLDIAEKNLEDCRLYAPVSGVVSSVSVEQGMNIPPYRPVVRLVDPGAAEVVIKVPEDEISLFSTGGTADVDVPSVGIAGIPATVISKGVSADPLSHSYTVRLSVADGHGILPGMTCRVRFVSLSESRFMIPGKAVSLSNDGRRYVWTVEDGRAYMRYVDIAGLADGGVLVAGGLRPGDTVVTEGLGKISEGMEVSVQ